MYIHPLKGRGGQQIRIVQRTRENLQPLLPGQNCLPLPTPFRKAWPVGRPLSRPASWGDWDREPSVHRAFRLKTPPPPTEPRASMTVIVRRLGTDGTERSGGGGRDGTGRADGPVGFPLGLGQRTRAPLRPPGRPPVRQPASQPRSAPHSTPPQNSS